jgi:hypothetical protein
MTAKGGVTGRAKYFAKVARETCTPRFRRSPSIRGTLQSGFSRAIFRSSAPWRRQAVDRSVDGSFTSHTSESLAMPGDDGVRLYDHDCRSPAAPRT